MSALPATAFVDVPLLLQAGDDRDPARRDRARDWLRKCWSERRGRLSVQVLNEYYREVSRQFATPIAAGDARAEVRRYQHWKPWQVDHATVETAWAIESRYGLPYWDALVVASAQQQGCACVLSDRLPHGMQIDSVQVLDPFLTPPERLDQPWPGPV